MTVLLALLERFWRPVAVAVVILATLAYIGHLRSDRDAIRKEYAGFVATVKAQGEAAQKSAEAQESADKKRKELADAENARLRSANAALSRSLRESRASGGYLPSAPSGSASPDRACFSRDELERAIQRLDAGIQGLIDEGDAARIDLDTAREWAAH